MKLNELLEIVAKGEDSLNQFKEDKSCLFTSLIERAHINAPLIKYALSELQLKILGIVGENPHISYDKMIELLGKERSVLRRNIQKLKALNILRRIGSRKMGHWDLSKQ